MATESPPELVIDIQNATQADSAPDKVLVEACVKAAIDTASGHSPRGLELSVRMVDAVESRNLNYKFRQIDKATNVLSFPATDPDGLPQEQPRPLGDIVICGPVVEREAADQGKNATDHWSHMLIHGTLHLLGYDHENDADAEAMEQMETRILASRGIGNPYTERKR